MGAKFLLVGVLAVSSLARANWDPRTIPCPEANTGATMQVKVSQIKARLAKLPEKLQQKNLYVIDLPRDIQERRELLPASLETKDWCLVSAQLASMEKAIQRTEFNKEAVVRKFAQLERWSRTRRVAHPKVHQLERYLVDASSALAKEQWQRANSVLNRFVTVLTNDSDPWNLPEFWLSEAYPNNLYDNHIVRTEEAAQGCPDLFRGVAASAGENVEQVVHELKATMDKRRIRAMDLQAGEELFAELNSYLKLGAPWATARLACGILSRVRYLDVDLGTVAHRFQKINELRDNAAGINKKSDFHALVRSASEHIAQKEFADAHQALDDLLIMLGDSAKPSAVIGETPHESGI